MITLVSVAAAAFGIGIAIGYELRWHVHMHAMFREYQQASLMHERARAALKRAQEMLDRERKIAAELEARESPERGHGH